MGCYLYIRKKRTSPETFLYYTLEGNFNINRKFMEINSKVFAKIAENKFIETSSKKFYGKFSVIFVTNSNLSNL